MARTVDRTVEELDGAMRALNKAARGIPFRIGSFRNTHRNLTQDVAHLMVQIDAARGVLNNK